MSPRAHGKGAAAFLDENEKLTEQEKADFRQVMLVLEILEARQQFANSMKAAPAQESRTASEKANKVTDKKEKPKTTPAAEKAAEVKTEPASAQKAKEVIPQEKQMTAEEN